jgi:DNA-binding NarL/FixJ family response regulator
VREGLRLLIEAADDIEVVGEAEDGRQAVAMAEKLVPHVVILDIIMPRLNGVEATRQLVRSLPEAKILVLSSYSEDEQVHELVEAGASGYLVKASAAGELLTAIREIHAGRAFLSPAVCKSVMEECRESLKRKRTENALGARLTSRETEVLQLVAEGYANKQIADVLGISTKTAEKHRQELMNKLNIHDTASLTRYAVSRRLVEPPCNPFSSSPTPAAAEPAV